ncbi:carboxymuconolactone decarboxylase family protein [Pseudodonghicola flavimaris]|uniref:Carboxymuconolactone decarboxylase family protein n=1 Tax=Pseudodonghicola flavimaris TaxID=3050036 RepID=A0ABT7EV28_9RHOB|nr:carboxymuconolactone decarboxylase family protein [Pseudodonghicola flavimaris]MDK3016202.1 carboxymuconolactone decarboxylase family protein [Pseudodonghicola flavimaris]
MSETPKNPFEAMMKQAHDMARAFNPALESFSPKGFEALWPTMPKDFMEFMFGNAFNKEGLDAKTRLLLTLAGLTMQGAQADTAVRQTVRHAIEAGAKKQEIVETIGQMSVFAGIPAMTRALELAREAMAGDNEDDEA